MKLVIRHCSLVIWNMWAFGKPYNSYLNLGWAQRIFGSPSKYFNYLTYKGHKSIPFGFKMCKKGLILLSYQVKFQNVTQNRLHLFLLMLQFSLDTLYIFNFVKISNVIYHKVTRQASVFFPFTKRKKREDLCLVLKCIIYRLIPNKCFLTFVL